MFNLLKTHKEYIDNIFLMCDKFSRGVPQLRINYLKKLLKGLHYGTNHDLKKYANLNSTQKNFFTLFLDQLILQKNRHKKILPETTNSPSQNSSPLYSPLLPAEKAREWI